MAVAATVRWLFFSAPKKGQYALQVSCDRSTGRCKQDSDTCGGRREHQNNRFCHGRQSSTKHANHHRKGRDGCTARPLSLSAERASVWRVWPNELASGIVLVAWWLSLLRSRVGSGLLTASRRGDPRHGQSACLARCPVHEVTWQTRDVHGRGTAAAQHPRPGLVHAGKTGPGCICMGKKTAV